MKRLGLAVSIALIARSAVALETASFLNVGVGARASAMGGAYTALADGPEAAYWNPAGLAPLETRAVTASHAELAQSIRHDFVGYAQPTAAGTFAAGATYLSQPALDGRDAAGRPTGDFQASDAAVALSFGRKTDVAEFGATVKYLRSHIGSAEAHTGAADFGVRRAVGPVLLGAALRNAGRGMKFGAETDDLPLRLALGAAYRIEGGHAVAVEATNSPRGEGTNFGFGGEYQAVKNVFLRAGYTTQTSVAGGSSFDAARGLTLGLGLRFERWSLDYAAVPMGELGGTHRFTLGARF